MSFASFLRMSGLSAGFSLLAACSSLPAPTVAPRAGTDLPAQFLVEDAGKWREARAGEGCRNPVQDPRDSTTLTLAQSRNGTGDYVVPPGKYGASAGEWLRLECASGRPLGLVR